MKTFKNRITVLSVGNSFAYDSLYFIPELCRKSDLIDLDVGILYQPGGSIKDHIDKYPNDSYDFHTYNDGWISEKKTLIDVLQEKKWDYIILQQASHDSGLCETYNDIPLLRSIIETNIAYDPVYVWLKTWSYSKSATHWAFNRYQNDQQKMNQMIAKCVEKKIDQNTFKLIVPVGDVIQYARDNIFGDTLNRDGFHLTKDIGRTIASLTTFYYLTGINLSLLDKYLNYLSSEELSKVTLFIENF